jgi:hypothetical protein
MQRGRLTTFTAAATVVLTMLAAVPCRADDDPPRPPPVLNDEGLLRKYVWATLGGEGVLNATLWSSFEQWRGAPPEWNKDVGGYGRRWASEYAQSAIGSTTKYAVSKLLRQDPSFTRCECTGAAPRLRHALAAPFTARTRDGRRVVSPAIVAGLAAEHIIPAATWYPAPHGTRDGVIHAGSGIVSKMAVNIFREFVALPKKP